MVVRSRLRAIFIPMLLYTVAGSLSGYFVWTANNGERGLKAKLEYKRQIGVLRSQIADLQDQREQWAHRVVLMRSENVDRDLAGEQARAKLGYVDSRDVVIFENTIKP